MQQQFIKKMTVTNIPAGKGYVPGLKIAGQYFQNLGFTYGDTVILTHSEHGVLISKEGKQ